MNKMILKKGAELEYSFEPIIIKMKELREKYKNLLVTEESRKELKSDRAELNKILKDYEDKRKTLKKEIMVPYLEFEELYKKNLSIPLNEIINDLGCQFDTLENELKDKKEKEVIEYFNNFVKDNPSINFIEYKTIGINVTLSRSLKKLKSEVEEFLTKAVEDVYTISSMEDHIKIMAIYKITLDLSKSIKSVEDTKKAEEKVKIELEEKKKREEELKKVKELNPPKEVAAPKKVENKIKKVEIIDAREEVKVNEKTYKATFELTGSLEDVKKLAEFKKLNNINIKLISKEVL